MTLSDIFMDMEGIIRGLFYFLICILLLIGNIRCLFYEEEKKNMFKKLYSVFFFLSIKLHVSYNNEEDKTTCWD